jgi:hypothetical protein
METRHELLRNRGSRVAFLTGGRPYVMLPPMALRFRIAPLVLPILVALLVVGHTCGLAGETFAHLLPVGAHEGADHDAVHHSDDHAGQTAHVLSCETAIAQQGQTSLGGAVVLAVGLPRLGQEMPVAAWPRLAPAPEVPHQSSPLYLRHRSLLI